MFQPLILYNSHVFRSLSHQSHLSSSLLSVRQCSPAECSHWPACSTKTLAKTVLQAQPIILYNICIYMFTHDPQNTLAEIFPGLARISSPCAAGPQTQGRRQPKAKSSVTFRLRNKMLIRRHHKRTSEIIRACSNGLSSSAKQAAITRWPCLWTRNAGTLKPQPVNDS